VQRLADGRAEFNRFADAFKDVKEGVLGMFQNLRLRLAKQYQVLAPADTVYTQVTEVWTDSATLGTDPVTATS
jgi:hypothetical protein